MIGSYSGASSNERLIRQCLEIASSRAHVGDGISKYTIVMARDPVGICCSIMKVKSSYQRCGVVIDIITE
jgi:hypothetical protein